MKLEEWRPWEPNDQEIANALQWRRHHSQHVADLVEATDASYPPTCSDCLRPELWKGAHWKWLMSVVDTR